MIGHPQGASGAAGVVAAALALSRGFLPPTINLTDPDPACDWTSSPTRAGPRRPRRRSATASASGRRTARSSSGAAPMTDDVVDRRAAARPARWPRCCSRARGARVRVFERARFPAHKLCGDTLNPGALACWPATSISAGSWRAALPIDGMRPDRARRGVRCAAATAPASQGRAVTRDVLDAWLLSQAVAAGAQRRAKARRVTGTDATRTAPGVVVACCVAARRDGRALAHARDSRHRRRRPPLAASRSGVGLARQPRRIPGAGPSAPTSTERRPASTSLGEMHVRDGHYIGVAPVPGGLANACLVVPHAPGDGAIGGRR